MMLWQPKLEVDNSIWILIVFIAGHKNLTMDRWADQKESTKQ